MSKDPSCIFCIDSPSPSRDVSFFCLGYIGGLSGSSPPKCCPTHEPMFTRCLAETMLVAIIDPRPAKPPAPAASAEAPKPPEGGATP